MSRLHYAQCQEPCVHVDRRALAPCHRANKELELTPQWLGSTGLDRFDRALRRTPACRVSHMPIWMDSHFGNGKIRYQRPAIADDDAVARGIGREVSGFDKRGDASIFDRAERAVVQPAAQ